jgi:hypothetical protein
MVQHKNLSHYLRTPVEYDHWSPEPERDPVSGAVINRVSPNETGPSIQGSYHPNSHLINKRNDLRDKNEPYSRFVDHHESGHALGLIHEDKTDRYAAYKTAKPEFIRGPFYRPPINLN